MKQNGIQHAPEDETFATKQVLQKLIGPQMYSVLFTLNKSSFQLCQKPDCFAASAQNFKRVFPEHSKKKSQKVVLGRHQNRKSRKFGTMSH